MSGLGRFIFDYFSFIFKNENKKARKIRFLPKASKQSKSINIIEEEDVRKRNRKRSDEDEAYLSLRSYQSMQQEDNLDDTNAINGNHGLNISGKYTSPNKHQNEIFNSFQKSERTNKLQKISNLRINQEICYLGSNNDIKDGGKKRQNSLQSETSLNLDRNHQFLPQVDFLEESNVIDINRNLNTSGRYAVPNKNQNEKFGRHQISDKMKQFRNISNSRNNEEICSSGSNNDGEIEKQNRICSCQCKACFNINRNQSLPQTDNHKIAPAVDNICRQKSFSKYTLPNETQNEAFGSIQNQFRDPTSFRNQRESCPSDDSGVVCDGSRKTSSVDLFLSHASVYFDAVPWFQREFEHTDAKIFGTSNEYNSVQHLKGVISEEFEGALKNNGKTGTFSNQTMKNGSKCNLGDVSVKSIKCSGEGEACLNFQRHHSVPQIDEVTNAITISQFRNNFSKYNHEKEDFDEPCAPGEEIGIFKRNQKKSYSLEKSSDPWSSIGLIDSTTKKNLILRRVKSADLNTSEMCCFRKEVEWRDPKNMISIDQRPSQSRIPVFKTKKQSRNKTKYRCDGRFGWNSFWNKKQIKNSCLGISIAHKSLLSTVFEKKFPEFTKTIYRGNIMDYISHSKWMKQAGIYQEENAAGFKRYAQKKVVLTFPEYKEALAKICEDYGLDYWEVLIKMTNVAPKSNTHSFSDVSSD